MAYTAQKLITRAWYVSGIVARNLETVTGDQLSDGLDLLNALLDFKANDLRLIPYFSRYAFNMIVGQETYFIPNLLEVETLTFNIGSVRYSMLPVDRVKYFGTGRVDNITSLPYNYHIERGLGGATIYVYFLPDQAYASNLSGKFGLTDVAINTDLLTVYDPFYIEYLRYALAEFMCDEYEVEFQPSPSRRLATYIAKLTDLSPPDLSITKLSSLQSDVGINYADVNVGRGWRP